MSSTALHRTPRCEVHWDGFVSDTYTLQSCGWDAAIERGMPHHYGVRLMLRHRESRVTMLCESQHPWDALHAEAWGWRERARDNRPPVFRVTRCAPDGQMTFVREVSMRPLAQSWERVDLQPIVSETVERSRIFPEWRPETREFVVAPDKVADLMERIRQLQEPELAEIRERNRRRDARERPAELHHATILSIAA